MQKYINSVASSTGAPVGGASVQVNVYPGGTPATIYSDNGITQAANPLTTDLANGSFSFYAADGHYQLVVTGSNIQPITLNDVLLVDAIPSDQAVASSVNSSDILSIQQGGTLKQATGALVASMVLGADSPIPVANGGTGATTAAAARTNLGAAASGANADITSLTGLTTPLSLTEGGTGASTAAGARTALGLGSMATQNANSVAITGGTLSGVTLTDLASTAVPGGAGLIGFDGNTLDHQFLARASRVIDSIAALRLLSHLTYTRAQYTGYYQAGDGATGDLYYDPTDTTSGALCTGSVSGSVLTVSAVTNGTLAVGRAVSRSDTGATIGYIVSFGTGTGGTGTYNLSASTTVASMTLMVDDGGSFFVAADGARWKLELSSPISAHQFGAKGDGSTIDSWAFASLISWLPSGAEFSLKPGANYSISGVSFNGKAITVNGRGATITSNTAGAGAFSKTDHGNKLTVIGVTFAGAGQGIRYVAATTQTMYNDLSVEDCKFTGSDYGIYMDGVRENRIVHCDFEGTNGIYRVRTVNTNLIACNFKNCTYGVNDDGDNTPYSAGLWVSNCTMIGCTYGVRTNEADSMSLVQNTIDYCDNPIYITGTYPVTIGDNYISTRSANPAIYVNTGITHNTVPQELIVHDNEILSHGAVATADCLQINNVTTGFIIHNNISFFWRYGILYGFCTDLKIEQNYFAKDPASTVGTPNCVNETGAGVNAATNTVQKNIFSSPSGSGAISVQSATQIWRNRGYLTENSGEAIIGSGVTSYVVAHGLNYTPAVGDCILAPATAGINPYVSAVDATNLTIGFSAATPSTVGVNWRIQRPSII